MSSRFGQGITVPAGKRILFSGITAAEKLIGSDGNPLCILDEDLTITINSNYESLLDASTNSMVTAAVGFIQGATGIGNIPVSFKQFGYQQWSGTDPIGLSFGILLKSDSDAYAEVVVPAQIIMAMSTPVIIDSLGGLAAPGPNLYNALFNQKHFGLSIDVGSAHFDQCFIKNVEPTLSHEIDDRGYPIWCKLRLTVSTVFTANTNMIYNMFPGIKQTELNNNSENLANEQTISTPITSKG
jgi:hypothetical protein